MTNQFRWDGWPLSLTQLDEVAGDLKTKAVLPGTARFHFIIHSAIISYFLGHDWFRDHLLPDAHPNSFLRPDFSTAEVDPKYSVRTLELAEMLLNLQNIRGFRRCLEHLTLKQVQSGLAELQIGQVLQTRGVPFRYVEDDEATTVDIVFRLPTGTEAFAEIKCKEEETPYSDATLQHALAKARQQIGKGNAGVVFVKVPTAWVEISQSHPSERADIRLPAPITAAAKRAMRKSSRIKKIIFYVVHYAYEPSWGLGSTHVTMEMSNPLNTAPWTDNLLGAYEPGPWVRMPELHSRWTA
jgi:hypothetical protein